MLIVNYLFDNEELKTKITMQVSAIKTATSTTYNSLTEFSATELRYERDFQSNYFSSVYFWQIDLINLHFNDFNYDCSFCIVHES